MENVNMYLKSSGMYRFGTFLVAHTNTRKKIGSGIMMRMLPIWYNFKMCTNL